MPSQNGLSPLQINQLAGVWSKIACFFCPIQDYSYFMSKKQTPGYTSVEVIMILGIALHNTGLSNEKIMCKGSPCLRSKVLLLTAQFLPSSCLWKLGDALNWYLTQSKKLYSYKDTWCITDVHLEGERLFFRIRFWKGINPGIQWYWGPFVLFQNSGSGFSGIPELFGFHYSLWG